MPLFRGPPSRPGRPRPSVPNDNVVVEREVVGPDVGVGTVPELGVVVPEEFDEDSWPPWDVGAGWLAAPGALSETWAVE